MDSRGNIKPLGDFPEGERKAAQERLDKFLRERELLLEDMLTEEGKAKLDRAEAKLERQVLYGEDE